MPTVLDRLSTGRGAPGAVARTVVAQVLAEPELIDELFDGIADDRRVVRGRAIVALEQVTAQRPELLRPYKREILTQVLAIDYWLVRSVTCLLLPRLDNLTARERRRLIAHARACLHDDSRALQANALEGLVRLAAAPGFPAEREQAAALVETCAAHSESPALRARARQMRRFLAKLATASPGRLASAHE